VSLSASVVKKVLRLRGGVCRAHVGANRSAIVELFIPGHQKSCLGTTVRDRTWSEGQEQEMRGAGWIDMVDGGRNKEDVPEQLTHITCASTVPGGDGVVWPCC